MTKKITIELTEQEYNDLCKAWETAKKSPVMPSKALNIDDFCKEIIVGMIKMPDLSNLNMEDLMSQLGGLGDLDNLKDMLGGLGKKPETKKEDEQKKDELPDDQKYKS